jgi:hypothetical protein
MTIGVAATTATGMRGAVMAMRILMPTPGHGRKEEGMAMGAAITKTAAMRIAAITKAEVIRRDAVMAKAAVRVLRVPPAARIAVGVGRITSLIPGAPRSATDRSQETS